MPSAASWKTWQMTEIRTKPPVKKVKDIVYLKSLTIKYPEGTGLNRKRF